MKPGPMFTMIRIVLGWRGMNVTGGTFGSIRRPPGKGAQLIILGAGSETGWIPNTTLIFRSKKILVMMR